MIGGDSRSLSETPVAPAIGGWVKRLEDIIGGTLFLLIAALPMLLIAVGVKLSSTGSVLFHQRRGGLNGTQIRVPKFRTMKVLEDGPRVKQAELCDPRLTRLGAILRRHSLDELPQLILVVSGHMSIVGPRPHALVHDAFYRECIPGYLRRYSVKPGITGWAQVNGWRGRTETLAQMAKRIEYDLDYIENWSLLLDLKIIWLSVFGSKTNLNAH